MHHPPSRAAAPSSPDTRPLDALYTAVRHLGLVAAFPPGGAELHIWHPEVGSSFNEVVTSRTIPGADGGDSVILYLPSWNRDAGSEDYYGTNANPDQAAATILKVVSPKAPSPDDGTHPAGNPHD